MAAAAPTYLGLKGQPLVYAVTFCCSIGFLLFGYDLGFMGGLTTSPEFLGVFGNPNSSLLGFLVAAYEVGAMCGAIYEFTIGDRFGRKPNNIAGAIIVAIGAILQTSSFGLAQFLVGRLVAGFGLGMMTTVIPIWLSECTTPKSRGRMMAMQLSNLIMGLIVSNWLDYGMAFHSGSVQWRVPCAFQVVFCVVVCVFMPWLPESPRWLAAADKTAYARRSLAALRGMSEDAPDVVEELQQIEYAIAIEAEQAGSWSDCFTDGGISGFTRVAIGFSANFFQQLSGVNVMSSLGPYVFQTSIGMTRYDALLVAGGLQVFYFLSSLIPWYVIDRVGRRKLFMIGSAGMGTCMLLSAIFVGVGTTGLGYAAAVVLYIFQTFFTLGWQSNMWIYPSELLPLKLRLRGGSLAVVSQWLFTFVVVEITPPMITNIGFKSYIVFAVINFVTLPIVYLFYPETSGLPLEAVDLLFADRDGQRPSIFRVVQDSKNKEFMSDIRQQLADRAHLRAENEDIISEAKRVTERAEDVDVEAVEKV
jgi:sugar porter (SP) family MFS transporter